MAIVGEGVIPKVTGKAPQRKDAKSWVTPRVSTPEPVDEPRLEDDTDMDFGSFFGDTDTSAYTPAVTATVPFDFISYLSGLKLPGRGSWLSMTSPRPSYQIGGGYYSGGVGLPQILGGASQSQPTQKLGEKPPDKTWHSDVEAAILAGAADSRVGKFSYGPSAYGFKGTTGGVQHKGKAPYGFQDLMWTALGAANAAMKAAGLGEFGISSGFRSYAGQVAAKKSKGKLAATPGRSVHGLGLAADLGLTSAQFNWLKKNGARFGLVNLPSESWHWQLAPNLWASRSGGAQ